MSNINYRTVAKKSNYGLEINNQNGYNWNDVKEFGKKVRNWYEKYVGDAKVSYSTNGETSNTNIEMGPGTANDIPKIPTERQINDDNYQAAIIEQYEQLPQIPTAYKANAAKTATSIKQGGMTKNEIIDFNKRHPNETAQGVNL